MQKEKQRTLQLSQTATDVAAYILQRLGPMTAWRLQKLVYYCWAWSLVWYNTLLFMESVEAWENGPVVRELYELHRGQRTVHNIDGNPAVIMDTRAIDRILEGEYAELTPQELRDRSHEGPYLQAMKKGRNTIISAAASRRYYGKRWERVQRQRAEEEARWKELIDAATATSNE